MHNITPERYRKRLGRAIKASYAQLESDPSGLREWKHKLLLTGEIKMVPTGFFVRGWWGWRLVWWKAFHKPAYKAGQIVFNRYNQKRDGEVLREYQGPYIGWCDGHWRITESWRCLSGAVVAVGYFWLPTPSPSDNTLANFTQLWT